MCAAPNVPEKPSLDGIEDRWMARWDADGIHAFDRTAPRSEVFSVDTPPPTVSGSIHMGTVFGYTQTDAIARHQRMRGKAVFFPIGWDDNGLATERRVQNFFGVRCDPSQPFDPHFQPPYRGDVPKGHHEVPVSRPNFVALCHELVQMDEVVFEDTFRRLGLSYDWSLLYTTIGEVSRRVSQTAFLRNLARGEAYSAEAPTLWDVDYRTAVAQAEMEDRERPGAYHLLAFSGEGGDLLVDTTRPELVVSCVAVVAHPDDERYQPLFGTTVRTPVFDVEVPVLAHPLALTDKGTGAAMVCTFGDVTDVTWWRELDLPTRNVVGRDGRFVSTAPEWLASDTGRTAYEALAGRTVKQAQSTMVEALGASGALRGEPRAITHPVKFYERGERPLEIVTSRQWYLRNGGRDAHLRDAFLRRGRELEWHPDFMRHRYEHWVEGLNGDWLISRQRFFGVPIPLWYALDADGEADHEHPLLPDESILPIDPSTDVPPGYTAERRGLPGGFVGDPDVMDTWATSSLTPQIAGQWNEGNGLFERVFPMDIRPQGPEIIRTWLFSTVVRSHHEFDSLPWRAATLNGWILDEDRKKMSKSKGNVVTPSEPMGKYGTDALRYWSVSARPGADTAVSEGQMAIGRKLAMKLLNASKFVLGIPFSDAAGEAPGAAVPNRQPGPTTDEPASHDTPGKPTPDAAGEAPGGAAVPNRQSGPTTDEPASHDTPGKPTADAAGEAPGAAVPNRQPGPTTDAVTEPLDRAMLARLDATVAGTIADFDGYDYARALEHTEEFFWWFCDDYVELVKSRAYGTRGDGPAASAQAALRIALSTLHRLFAPFLPFVAEEVWSWWQDGSVHVQAWPAPTGIDGDVGILDPIAEVLAVVRRAKTEAKLSQRATVAAIVVTGPGAVLDAVRAGAGELRDAGSIAEIDYADGPELACAVTLGAPA